VITVRTVYVVFITYALQAGFMSFIFIYIYMYIYIYTHIFIYIFIYIGERALSLLESSSKLPDIVVLDQNMSSAGGRLLGHEVGI
jgi:cellulose synthase/poly-beta-1,6-N-acetylglucosamine synthase-like glycosyltransferase